MNLSLMAVGNRKHYLGLITFLVILSCTTIIKSQNIVKEDPCINKMTCGECIQSKDCGWCMQEKFGNQPRCFHQALSSGICPDESTYSPTSDFRLLLSQELTHNHRNIGDNKIVKIMPQRIQIKLRIGEDYRFKFHYVQAEDYPIDVYFLIDLSKSMENEKNNLSKLDDALIESMTNITNNLRLGFGSFGSEMLKQPCDQCEPTYSFKNHMALSSDTKKFSDGLKNVVISENVYESNISSNALIQAIVCRGEIGWRPTARRILVLITDGHFNVADNKKGDAVIANDGNCHLDSDGNYVLSPNPVYPSISQINTKVLENMINIIFAIPDRQNDEFNRLSRYIDGATTGKLSNVVQLIANEYNKISSLIEMNDNATDSVKITYYSACLTGSKPIQTNKCDNLKNGQLVSFEARIDITSCPANRNEWYQTIIIHPIGVNDSLVVELEMICNCPLCEVSDSPLYEQKSEKCSGYGTYKCGICDCDVDYYGNHCECSALGGDQNKNNNNGCRQSYAEIDCNGRGNCICGVCECEKRENFNELIYGQFCECDNFSCDRHNGLICSGPDHGTCECGQCVCKYGWTGPACDCPSTFETCVKPGSEALCSDRGECVCGKCLCRHSLGSTETVSGEYCERYIN